MCTWDELSDYMQSKYEVVKEWPGQGFIFDCEVAGQPQRMFLARNNPGFGAVDYVTVECALGSVDQVDLVTATRGRGSGLGGIVTEEDLVSIRESRCLETLSIDHLAALIGAVSGGAVGYFLAVQP